MPYYITIQSPKGIDRQGSRSVVVLEFVYSLDSE